MKKARRTGHPDYECQKPWPESCFVQSGGYMASEKTDPDKNYRTAFVEAYPNDENVDTFIRANAETIEEAEEKAWELYQKYSSCEKDHTDPESFERRDYKNGSGFCKTCGQFKGSVFEPTSKCIKCGEPTYHTCDKNGDWWCELHSKTIPDELLYDHQIFFRDWDRRLEEEGPLEVTDEALKTVITRLAAQAKDLKND